jgi:hypothetical protein
MAEKYIKVPLSFSLGRQIIIFLISALLPPFGLNWAYKYYRNDNPVGRRIGFIIIIITIISLIINLMLFKQVYKTYRNVFNINSQQQMLKELGY